MEKFKTNIQIVNDLDIDQETKDVFASLCNLYDEAVKVKDAIDPLNLGKFMFFVCLNDFSIVLEDAIILCATQEKKELSGYVKVYNLFENMLEIIKSEFTNTKIPERNVSDMPGATN